MTSTNPPPAPNDIQEPERRAIEVHEPEPPAIKVEDEVPAQQPAIEVQDEVQAEPPLDVLAAPLGVHTPPEPPQPRVQGKTKIKSVA